MCVEGEAGGGDLKPLRESVYTVKRKPKTKIGKQFGISFSRGASQPGDGTQVSCISSQILYHRATREALDILVAKRCKLF